MSIDARLWMGSYAFTATPGKSGEAMRSLLLKQACQVPIPPTLMALVGVIAGWLMVRSPLANALLKTSAKRLLPRKFVGAGGDGLSALRRLLQPALLLQATAIGVFAWSLEGVSLWLLLRGMGMESVTIGGATIAHTAARLIGALTLLPGGLGSTEAGTVGLLALQGVGVPAATPATLLIRLMTLWFATALGVLCLLRPCSVRGH